MKTTTATVWIATFDAESRDQATRALTLLNARFGTTPEWPNQATLTWLHYNAYGNIDLVCGTLIDRDQCIVMRSYVEGIRDALA